MPNLDYTRAVHVFMCQQPRPFSKVAVRVGLSQTGSFRGLLVRLAGTGTFMMLTKALLAAGTAAAAVACAGGVQACFHVGDTPMDIQAALAAGSTAVAVATGIFSREQLEAAGAAAGAAAGQLVVLDSLEDLDAVLKVLQLQ
jgi:ribonucleotide monophosphatase NagD (HAD superfamily)